MSNEISKVGDIYVLKDRQSTLYWYRFIKVLRIDKIDSGYQFLCGMFDNMGDDSLDGKMRTNYIYSVDHEQCIKDYKYYKLINVENAWQEVLNEV